MKEQPLPSLFHGALRGAAGGLAGAALGHVLVTLCLRGGGERWLKGPYGPDDPGFHFFDIALFLSATFGCIAFSLSRRAVPTLAGLGCAFLALALPLTVLTHAARAFPWWYWAVLGADILAVWGTTLALGALLCPARRMRGALFAALGSWAGYLVLELILHIVPSYAQGRWVPTSFIPSPVDLLTWLLAGAGMGAGIYLAGRNL